MGLSSCSNGHAQRELSADQYHAHVATIRRAVPGWARSHDEFEGAADECLVEALAGFDPSRGATFKSFLHLRVQSRVPTLLARQDRHRGRVSVTDDLEAGESGAAICRAAMTTPNEVDTALDDASPASVAQLPMGQQQVAALLAHGLLPGEVAVALGISKSAVSNTIKRLRSRGRYFYDGTTVDTDVLAA